MTNFTFIGVGKDLRSIVGPFFISKVEIMCPIEYNEFFFIFPVSSYHMAI